VSARPRTERFHGLGKFIARFDANPIIRCGDTSYLVIWATRREALALIFPHAILVSPNYI
jgi:hypothetical protein